MPKIYTAGSLYEAELLLHRLREAGIAARVLKQNLIGLAGELPHTEAHPEVWLDDAISERRARRIVDDYERRRRGADGPEKTCPVCAESSPSNFELCWSCRAPLE